MDLNNVISRFDDSIYDSILGGKDVIRVVRALDSDKSDLTALVDAFFKMYTLSDMLESDLIRSHIIDALRENEIKELAERLGVDLAPDPYGNYYEKIKKVSFRSADCRCGLYNFFELEYIEPQEKIHIDGISKLTGNYPLFRHQRNALKEVGEVFKKDNRVLLHMPTGSGKTRTAVNVICDQLRNNEPSVVVWLANAEELCDQTYEEIRKAWGNLGNREIEIARFYGSSKMDISSVKDGVIVCGLQKINALLSCNSLPVTSLAGRVSLVIIDEAHIAVAETYKMIMTILVETGNKSRLLGLSATPGRTWNDIEEDSKLSKLFNRHKVILKIDGYVNPVDYLVEEGYLAKTTYFPLYHDGGTEMSKNDIRYLKNNLRLSDQYINLLSRDTIRNIAIVNKVKELVLRHRRIILFALNVEHTIIITTALRLLGINAYSITTRSGQNERHRVIGQFKSDTPESMILCNYGILTTGFDAPKTSCAVITRPTDSLVLYSQMIGRAIRGEKAGGNKEAEIITVIDRNLPGFDTVASAFTNWEDVWD